MISRKAELSCCATEAKVGLAGSNRLEIKVMANGRVRDGFEEKQTDKDSPEKQRELEERQDGALAE